MVLWTTDASRRRAATGRRWLVATVLATACGVDPPIGPVRGPPAVIVLTPTDLVFDHLGASETVMAVVRDAQGNVLTDAVVSWRTSDEMTVTVSGAGEVVAAGNGTAAITATAGAASASVTVTVLQTVTSVEVTPATLTLSRVGDVATLVAVARDRGGAAVSSAARDWTTSDPDIAVVSPAGEVTAVGVGTTAVTARASDVTSDAVPVTVIAGAFQCTTVIGFSQTDQWFSAGFEAVVGDEGWQEIWWPGGAINLWADPDYEGWSADVVSPCAVAADAPDRVLLTISGEFHTDPDWWAGHIDAVVDLVRIRLPSAQRIVLQPVVGGPGHQECSPNGVRASQNHPVIDQAIALVVQGEVVTGHSPEVRTCDDYADFVGHLTTASTTAIGEGIGSYYVGR